LIRPELENGGLYQLTGSRFNGCTAPDLIEMCLSLGSQRSFVDGNSGLFVRFDDVIDRFHFNAERQIS